MMNKVEAKLNTQLNHQQIKKQTKTFPICILANNIEIAGNVGSLFRIAEAFGIEKLFLTGSTSVPPKYKIRKAACAADAKVPFEYSASAIEVVTRLQSDGYKIISLEVTSQSQDIGLFKMPQPQAICLIISSENQGIEQPLLDLSEQSLHIPMYGENSSMNVATSCAIAVYQLIKSY